MNKDVSGMLIFFFISGLFVTAFSSVSASILVEGSWNEKAPMQHARYIFGAVAVDNKIYAIGGVSDGVGIMDINERYDPAADTWVTLTSMPTPRSGFAIVAYQNKICCIGGYSADKHNLPHQVLVNVNEVYDITTDSWSTKAPLPVDESYVQALVVDEKIYAVTQQALYVYDPVVDYWASKTSTPIQGIHGYSVVVDNKIIVVDQVAHDSYLDYSEVRVIATMKIMIYDPKTDVWSKGQTSPEYIYWDLYMLRPLVAGTTTGTYAPQKIYIIHRFSNYMYIYDPVEDTWTTDTGPPNDVVSYGEVVVDDILYIFGGFHYLHVENIQYVPMGHKGAVPTPKPSSTTTVPPTNTPEQTNLTTSEPTNSSKPTLTTLL
ncbi:MAG: hypothetical protein FWF66_02015 [Candidatus Bathyarchaeota archaeon]|nr:hypothetical protein [Candidatus Termiticorpusculum sp.]